MNLFKKIALIISLVLVALFSSAQLTIDENISAENAVQQLVGAGISIDNVIVTAADSSWAYYNNVNTELSNGEGLLLTTGKARNAIVENGINGTGLPDIINQTECLNCEEFDNDFPGSTLLNNIYPGNTFDATTFQFDVLVQGDSLEFDFTFASEEYEEWVGSSFNDVFGFFITGPGGFNDVNIALVPGTTDAVAINSVNHITNTEYYYDNRNPLGQNVQYDGFTVGLKAQVGGLTPCETYTLKLIVADRSDRLYDSAVFIEKLSSNFSDIEVSTVGGTPYMIEGCNDGQVTFIADVVLPVDQDILYSFGGTADITSDYTVSPSFGNNIPNQNQTITIPANESSVTIDVTTIDDGVTEGDEYIALYVINEVCDVEIQDSILFVIKDSLELSVIPEIAEICPGDEILLQGISDTNGNFSFSWEPSSEVDSPNDLTTTASPLTSTTYTLTSNLASCTAEASAEIDVKTLDLIADVTPVNCAGAAIGEIDITILNVTDPYTVSWTDSDGNEISTDEDISGLEAGVYTITVTDADGCELSEDVTVFEDNTLVSNLTLSNFNGCNISCFGLCDGSATVLPQGGSGPYTITWSESVPPNTFSLSDLCAGVYSVTIEDSESCSITETFNIVEPEELEGAVLSVSEILCNGTSTGIAEVNASGGKPPYAYSWSDDPDGNTLLGQGPILTNLGDGTYYVTVTDFNDCVASNSIVVTVLPPPPPIEITLSSPLMPNGFNTSCFDSEDATVSAVVTGGVPGYSYLWTNSSQDILGSGPTLTNEGCGEVTLTVVDQNGCEESETYDITCPPQIVIDIDVTPNPCNDPLATDGIIDITPSGGSGMGYTFSWEDQNNLDFGMNEDLFNLPSGTYTVTVTDSDGCSRDFTIPVTNEDSIVIGVDNVQNNTCFEECDGSIEITITGAVGDYDVEWSNLDGIVSTDEDLTNACADTYFLVVTGEDDCQATQTFIITEPSEIIIDLVDAVDPTCFGQNSGSIDIDVSGGDGPLEIEWLPFTGFAGSTDEDIEQLVDGTYTVIVTDTSNGCTETLDVTIEGPVAILIDIQLSSYDGGFNTSCNGALDGWANAAASGGNPDFENLPFGYFYDWSSNDFSFDDPSLPNQANLPGGITYSLIVTDTAGCQGEISLPLTEPNILEAAEEIIPVSCNGLKDGRIIPNITGGSGNYVSYEWTGDIGDNEADADTLFNLCPGTFTLEVFDSNDCTFTETFIITEPDPLEVEITDVSQEDCFGSSTASVTVTGVGGTPDYTYDWIDDEMNTYTGPMLTDIPSGSYYVTVEDENGCIAMDTVEVNSEDVFTLDVDLFQVGLGDYTLACLGDINGSAVANVSGGIPDYSYIWTDEMDDIIGTEATISDLGAGTYYIDVDDLSGCMLNDSIIITEPLTEFIAEGNILTGISCFDECTGEIEVSATGGDEDYTFIWELNDDELEFDTIASSLCAGTYEVLASDANGCDTLMTFDLLEPEEILTVLTLSEYECGFNISCFGSMDGQINVQTSGGVPFGVDPLYTYEWTGDIGANSSDADELLNIGAGSFTLTVTDSQDCSIQAIANMTEPDELTVNMEVTNISCFDDDDGTVFANTTGGCEPYSFNWASTIQDVDLLDDLPPGSYEVDITDANGCEVSGTANVEEPELLSVSATTISTSCGLDNGSIDSTPSGGTGSYDFDWNNGADDVEDPTDLASGPYELTLTDENGCEATLPVDVDPSSGIEFQVQPITDVLCYGDANGCIQLDVIFSNGDAVVTWTDDNGDSANPCPAPAGTYNMTIVDDNDCEASGSYTINTNDSLSIELTPSIYENDFNISDFDGSDGFIDALVSGGTDSFSYSWNNGQTTEDISNLPAGTYILTVTDENDCESTAEITLIAPEDLTLPTGLTPNADGANDFFVILGLDQYDNVDIKVFNRWGNVVYSDPNYDNSWAGLNNNGDSLADGTYYVVAVGTKDGETKELNSFVDLRR